MQTRVQVGAASQPRTVLELQTHGHEDLAATVICVMTLLSTTMPGICMALLGGKTSGTLHGDVFTQIILSWSTEPALNGRPCLGVAQLTTSSAALGRDGSYEGCADHHSLSHRPCLELAANLADV